VSGPRGTRGSAGQRPDDDRELLQLEVELLALLESDDDAGAPVGTASLSAARRRRATKRAAHCVGAGGGQSPPGWGFPDPGGDMGA
jgi:hypothetical protein